MAKVIKIGEVYIAGIPHEIPGYLQDVVFITKKDNRWVITSAERFNSTDPQIIQVRDAVKYATLESDMDRAFLDLKSKGVKLEEVRPPYPFPSNLLRASVKIMEEVD